MIPHAPIGEVGSSLANKTGGWRIFIPVFNAELCNGCGTCETFCPEGIVHKIAVLRGSFTRSMVVTRLWLITITVRAAGYVRLNARKMP